jgi:hypothetical protein
MCGFVLCGVAIVLFASYRAYRLLVEVDRRAQQVPAERHDQLQDLASLRISVETLSAQVRDLQDNPQIAPPAGTPKPGFNLSKRSQALRMHRRGEAPERIAATLDLPRQEVELLLKIHRIVVQNVWLAANGEGVTNP